MARTPRTLPARRALALVLLLGACSSGGDEVADDPSATTAAPVSTAPASTMPVSAAPERTAPASDPPATTAPDRTEPTGTAPSTTAPAEPTTTTAPAITTTTTAPAATTTTAAAATTTTAPATTATTTTAGAATTTAAGDTVTTVVPAELVLDGTGLGVVEFGDPADPVIAALTAVLGEPTEDTGWVDPFTIGTCASNELRRVSWDSLSVTFGDNGTPGSRQFFTYSYGNVSDLAAEPAGLLTTTGIGIGASVADLRSAYPDVEIVPGEEGLIETSWLVDEDPDADVVQSVGGLLTGENDNDVVTVIYGGSYCG